MITSSGVICDVCGKHILPIDPDEMVNKFIIAGFWRELHCDNACRELVEQALCQKDWRLLPEGPLRKAFEEQDEEVDE